MKHLLILAAVSCLPICSCAEEPLPEPNAGAETPPVTIDLSGYDLIFADEFDGRGLDWKIWAAADPAEIKHETSRGREAVEVRDGLLRLNVRRVRRSNAKWLACYLYLKEPLERNVYLECRFRSGQAAGVNNSFWLACKTPPNTSYMNKYEIDIVEARQDVRDGTGKAHLAWHDWKTYSYAVDRQGNPADIAQGISVPHDFSQYHVWGLWYGENELIFYLDGKEMWRGRTSPLYPDQYYTGIGKAPIWNPQEQGRAYGNYGQEDWCYYGGYNGDRMHVVLANLPWGESWSPLIEEEADGSCMLVDYVRIYKPKRLSVTTPDTDLSAPAAEIALGRACSLAEEGTCYFSTVVTKRPGEELQLDLRDASKALVGKVIVDSEGCLLTGITKLASSRLAYSPYRGARIVPDNQPTLLVCRLTTHAGRSLYDRDAISVWCCPLDKASTAAEPYFYPNVDEAGNTSQTQEWYVNQKGYSDETVRYVNLSSTTGSLASFGRFRSGPTFLSVTR